MIAAFDVATAVGGCDGLPGGKPRLWTWYLDDAFDCRPGKLEYFSRLLDAYFRSPVPIDAVYYEEPLPLRVLMHIGADEETVAILRGLIGVLEARAFAAGIKTIMPISVHKARQALTGRQNYPKGKGKKIVMETVKMLGIMAANDHEADAYAVWNYGCAMQNPRIAHLVTPLFRGRSAHP